MSVYCVYKGNGGAKMMRPVSSREEYLKLRNGGLQVQNVARDIVGASVTDQVAILRSRRD